jgi:two-component system NtrC family sensor kinase
MMLDTRATSDPQPVVAELQRQLAERTAERDAVAARLDATTEILRTIAEAPEDADRSLQQIAETTARLFGAPSVSITIAENSQWTRRYGVGPSAQSVHAKLSPDQLRIGGRNFPGQLVSQNRQIHIPDLDHLAPEFADWPGPPIARAAGTRTMAGTPLRRAGIAIGALIVHRDRLAPFTADELALLQSFADQAGIALENARLFNEVQARTQELAASLDDLRTAQDRLVQTEKLASLGQLTAGIAHEIKNPLNFVNNFSALSAELVDELKDALAPAGLAGKTRAEVDELTELLKGNLEKVVQHGKRADSIVKNMLLHSREGSSQAQLADINALLDESLNLAYHGARAEKPDFNVTLLREFDHTAGMVEVFPQEITRAFLNFIANGFYAVTRRKAESGGDFEPALAVSTKVVGSGVAIRIHDNGTGIAPAVKEKIFNPFFTTKPAGEGTGLGLSMSHDIIVKQHGGSIEVKSEPGQFTEFTIVLPRTGALSAKERGQT